MSYHPNNLFSYPVRVYWEDTDGGGIVYYANYLKFAERARTEWLRALGISQSVLKETHGVAFVVRQCTIKYKISARLDDLLDITVAVDEISSHKLSMTQRVLRGNTCCAELAVELVVVDVATGRLVAIPSAVSSLLG